MKIVKKKLDDMYRCYCASNIYFDNQNHILLASEDPDVACNMYYGKDYETKENVWTHPGGCMSIVPIPGKEKEFLSLCSRILFEGYAIFGKNRMGKI